MDLGIDGTTAVRDQNPAAVSFEAVHVDRNQFRAPKSGGLGRSDPGGRGGWFQPGPTRRQEA
jgi:hypothetical protein